MCERPIIWSTGLGLPQNALLLALIAFNLGVELGQLTLVGEFLPLAWTLRQSWAYRIGIVAVGSLVVIAVATVWLVEQYFEFKLYG